jgi:hypothetical protein
LERSAEIEGVIRRLLRGIAASDVEAVAAFRSANNGRRIIGTDAREWYSGEAALAMEAQLPEYEAAGGMTLRIREIDGFEEGSVGWGASDCDARLGTSPPLRMRISVVLHLEQVIGGWCKCTVPYLWPTRTFSGLN